MEKSAKIISDIDNWFLQLDRFGITSIKDLQDPKNFHAASMVLFSIINGAITLGEEVVATKELGFPGSYREVFEMLGKNKIISNGRTIEMSKLVGYRNMFAHEYWSFSEKDVWDALQRVRCVNGFVAEIRKFLK